MGEKQRPKSDRQKIIGWYREDIEDYQMKINKYFKLIRTIKERIEALDKADKKVKET